MHSILVYLLPAFVLYILYTGGSQAAGLAGDTALARRQYDCSVAQCGQACFAYSPNTSCPFQLGDPYPWINVGDTAGAITPFNSTKEGGVPPIMSLLYLFPDWNETIQCPYILLSFYDANNFITGSTYVNPGQDVAHCISFDGEVTAYSGVTMLTTVPEELLELTNDYGNVMDEGYN